jgi:hypothetical protein
VGEPEDLVRHRHDGQLGPEERDQLTDVQAAEIRGLPQGRKVGKRWVRPVAMAAAKGRRVSAKCTYSKRPWRPSEFTDPLDGVIAPVFARFRWRDSGLPSFQQVNSYLGMPNFMGLALESVPST